MPICNNCGRKIKAYVVGKIICGCGGEFKEIGYNNKDKTERVRFSKMNFKSFSATEKDLQDYWQKLYDYIDQNKNNWNINNIKLFFIKWERDLPNLGCLYKKKWAKLKLELSPDFSSSDNFIKWCEEAKKIWQIS